MSVRPGVEVVLDRPRVVAGRRVGLVTNHTGRDRAGRPTADALGAAGARVVALFAPEHGIDGDRDAGERFGDAAAELPVFSLYGETIRPTESMLHGVDVLVFDLQDAGARCYTYASTLVELLRAGAAAHLPVVVLDRPDPIGGVALDGPVLDPRFASFVGAAPVPLRHGLTIGELGRYANAALGIGADLAVVPLEGWRRERWYDETGLPWIAPSPALRTLAAATVYPGTVLFERSGLSVGRGTAAPFEWIGAPGIDATAWAAMLEVPGARLRAARRVPAAPPHAGVACDGLAIAVTDRDAFFPVRAAVAMLAALRDLDPDGLRLDDGFDRLAGTDALRRDLASGRGASAVVASWDAGLGAFAEDRRPFLLY